MKAIGKIGVIIPEVTDSLDFEFLQGIYAKASEYGYDIIVFTGVFQTGKESEELDYISGQKNIFDLPGYVDLDGILLISDCFHSKKMKQDIYDNLLKVKCPVLVVEEESQQFDFLLAPQKESIKLLTNHLIEKHHATKIYCLTGPASNSESVLRLAGYCEAMEEHSLSYENCIFYGDFWQEKAKQLGRDIATGKIEKPQAIVCCNDIMAINLCRELNQQGLQVPDDLLITGYDGSLYACMFSPSITTVAGRTVYLGEQAISRLLNKIDDVSCHEIPLEQCLHLGESCGCSGQSVESAKVNNLIVERLDTLLRQKLDRKSYLTWDYISKMSEVSSMEEFIVCLDKMSGMLLKWNHFDLCLCKDWEFSLSNPQEYRRKGFSQEMILLLSKKGDRNEINQYEFKIRQILPWLNKPHEPQIVICTSLHSGNQILGYLATSYSHIKDFSMDEHYVNWSNAVANGLHTLQEKTYTQYQKERMEQMTTRDLETGLYNLRGIENALVSIQNKMQKNQLHARAIIFSWKSLLPETNMTGLTTAITVANALRLVTQMPDLLGRIDEKTFLILECSTNIPPTPNQELDGQLQKLHDKIKEMRGADKSVELFELMGDCVEVNWNQNLHSELKNSYYGLQQSLRQAERTMGNYDEELAEIRYEMKLSPQKDWSIPDIAKKMNVSGSHFQRLYKKQFEVSFMEDVIEQRIKKAKQLLTDTSLHVQEIAVQCGYQNTNHFMRQFKKRAGITALQYRKTN